MIILIVTFLSTFIVLYMYWYDSLTPLTTTYGIVIQYFSQPFGTRTNVGQRNATQIPTLPYRTVDYRKYKF